MGFIIVFHLFEIKILHTQRISASLYYLFKCEKSFYRKTFLFFVKQYKTMNVMMITLKFLTILLHFINKNTNKDVKSLFFNKCLYHCLYENMKKKNIALRNSNKICLKAVGSLICKQIYQEVYF